MPTYGYACAACGPFELVRPMAEYAQPQACPVCGEPAARAMLTVPALAGMDAGRRASYALNERSANAPQRSAGRHPAACGCCSPRKSLRAEAVTPKTSPGARPWMIGH
jgi:putative FmdB family regulatory protein